MKKTSVVYVGQRIWSGKGQVWQLFMHGKKKCWWSGRICVQIGARYECDRSGKNLSLPKIPKQIDEPKADKNIIRQWEALDKAAGEFRKQKRAATAYKNAPNVLDILPERLKPVVQGMSYREIKYFVEWLVDKLSE